MEFSCLTEVTTACKSTLISDKVLNFQPTESAVPAEEGGDGDEQRCDGVHGDGGEAEENKLIRSFSVSCVGDEARCLHTLSPAPATPRPETRLSPDTAPGRRTNVS